MSESFHHGLEALLHLLLTGGRDAAQRAPVEGVHRCEDFEAAFVVTKLPGRLEETLVGLGSGVAEKHFARGQMADQALGQSALGLLVIQVGDVYQPPGLFHQRLGDFGVGMAQRAHGDTAAQVQVALAGDIPDMAAGAVAQGQVESTVAWHHEALEQLADFLLLILQDRRRRR